MGNISSLSSSQQNPALDNDEKENEPITIKSTIKGYNERQNLQYGVSGMQGMRQTMEDRHIICEAIPIGRPSINKSDNEMNKLDDHSLFAVFDGHGGDFTSKYLEENFLSCFAKRSELSKYAALPRTGMKSREDVTGIQFLRTALMKTFIELDDKLGPLQEERNQAIRSGKIAPPLIPTDSNDDEDDDDINEDDDNQGYELRRKKHANAMLEERSGSTACVVVITPTHYICANAGDSRAVLRRNGNVLPLSFDHKPNDVPERKRIIDAGGIVKGKRVDGDLAVSRAFGDFVFKQDKELGVDKQRVVVIPDMLVYPRSMKEDEFIIVACDGIWDVASNKQCSDFVQSLLSEGEIDLGNICEEALDTCLDRKSRDNMTMMVVGLPGMKADTSGGKLVSNALWGPRITRASRDLKKGMFDFSHRACVAVGSQFIAVENVMCSTASSSPTAVSV